MKHFKHASTGALGDQQGYVCPNQFVPEMTVHWMSLGNTPSPALQEMWRMMAMTLNERIAAPATDTTWRVLQPPTGTGKTQGLCVYAALAARKNATVEQPVGILIVTRTIAQAEEIVATIRKLAGPEAALRVAAKHSENKITIAEMRGTDILVITHAAYTRALEGLSSDVTGRWEDHTEWAHGPRRLTVIDEALSGVIEENQVKTEHVRQVLSYIDADLERRFPRQVKALKAIKEVLDKINLKIANGEDGVDAGLTAAKILWRRVAFTDDFSMASLREEMARLRYDNLGLRKSSRADRRMIAAQVDQTLKDCEAIMVRWAYYYRKGRDDTVNSSKLLVPRGLPGPVVLDATATQNFLWRLMGDRVKLIEIPEGTRNYQNVTLHVARARGVGKASMEKKGKERISRLMAHFAAETNGDRKVLLCVHKLIEPFARTIDTGFSEFDVAHWGAIDGRNDWSHYDTAVIVGLPYRDQVWSTNTFFAIQGLQDDSWLKKPSWGPHNDVRREMERRQLTVSIVQAINRVRCRRVIDENGNCLPTDLFIVLPDGSEGDQILAHLVQEMPDIVVVPWHFAVDGAGEKVRKGSSHEAVVSFMKNQLPGETPISQIRDELDLPTRTVKQLQAALRDPEHSLTKTLAEHGVVYVTTGHGRGAQSFLLKR